MLVVFVADPPKFPDGDVIQGLAAGYPEDRGIERNPEVIFATGFDESGEWKSRWAKSPFGNMDKVSDDPLLHFDFKVPRFVLTLKREAIWALRLRDHGGEPDELYFRYYLRLADDWDPSIADGKLPGMAGTYGKAGWGG